MSEGIVTASYIGATVLFILALGGLSNQETSRRGVMYGMAGMAIALIVTMASVTANMGILIGGLVIGGAIGVVLAKRVQMTEMPELVAILHSLVGMAAVLVGFANFMDPGRLEHYAGVELTIHDIETYLGILIGAITFSGSVIAFGKLSGKMSGNPLMIPGRHFINLGLLLSSIYLCMMFVDQSAAGGGFTPLLIMTGIALLFGIHMVMAIGGADMPVVVSMLNSYSGWAASATGFMLNNVLVFVWGALVGSTAIFIYSGMNPMGSGLSFPPLFIMQIFAMALIGSLGGWLRHIFFYPCSICFFYLCEKNNLRTKVNKYIFLYP